MQELALALPEQAWKTVTWREGTRRKLKSRFAAVRVRQAHRDYLRSEPYPEEWLWIEWPKGETEPTQYWLSSLPPQTRLTALVRLAKHRWIIERSRFFPLCPRGPTGATGDEDSAQHPAPRLAACAPNAITAIRSPPFAPRLPAPCSSNSPAAPFAARDVDNTVVLVNGRSTNEP